MKEFIICLLISALVGLILKSENGDDYDRGFKDGKKTRIVYRCPNHDIPECEILGKRYD